MGPPKRGESNTGEKLKNFPERYGVSPWYSKPGKQPIQTEAGKLQASRCSFQENNGTYVPFIWFI